MRRVLQWGAGDRRNRRREERGAAALEFALILVPLMVLVLGIINFGWMLAFRQAMSQAAAEGARAAAVQVPGTPDADRQAAAEAAVNDALTDAYGVDCNAATCTIQPNQPCTEGPAGATCAVVELTFPQADYILVPGLGFSAIMPDDLTYRTEVRVS